MSVLKNLLKKCENVLYLEKQVFSVVKMLKHGATNARIVSLIPRELLKCKSYLECSVLTLRVELLLIDTSID